MEHSNKRKLNDSDDATASSGGALVVQHDAGAGALTVSTQASNKQIQVRGVQRTSSLFAPIMQLVGHGGSIYACKFSPDGQALATASFDKNIWLWRVFGETCENYAILKGHKNAVLDVSYTRRGASLVSCSADKSVALWDIETGERLRSFSEHRGIVNACDASRSDEDRCASVSDDGTVKIWDGRQRRALMTISHQYPLTAVCFGAQAFNVFAGGVDNVIRMYDLRKEGEVAMELRGHDDTISGLALAPDGGYVLSNSFDCTLRHWDVKPYCATDRCLKTFMGHEHSGDKNLLRCAYSPDGAYIASGSGDRMVYVWSVASTKILFKLPGHKGCVNEVVFHPSEPIIASCSNDKSVYLGELDLN